MRVFRPSLVLFCFLVFGAVIAAARPADEEFDNAKYKLQLYAWISSPSGYFNGKGGTGYFDLQRDFGFGNYATFSGHFDWRFKRKHHLLFGVTPVFSSRTTTLTRTIEWQGETYNVGARTSADIHSQIYTIGYQYDFARWRRGSIGFIADINLIYTSAKLSAAGIIGSGGSQISGAVSSSGSLFAPLPAIGPTGTWYPIPHSDKLYLDGALTGMSFFGYGNFVSGHAEAGYTFSPHWSAQAGYLMGSRLKIEGSSDQIAIRLTQKGPIFGVQYRWGTR